METRYSTGHLAISTILIMTILIFIGGQDPARAMEPRYGGTLRYVGELDGMGFDAIKARALYGSGRMVANLVMEKLFDRGKKGELIPVLGLSAALSADQKMWTIKLRQGVTFHDGNPFQCRGGGQTLAANSQSQKPLPRAVAPAPHRRS